MPRAPKFTDRNIVAEAKPGKLLFVRDCPNLYLYTSAGKKRRQRWILRFSRPDRSGVTTKSLGPYPEVTIEMAKNRAEQARKILKVDKINPFEVDWNDGATTTFGEVARKWLNDRKDSWKNPKQFRDIEYLLLVFTDKELVEKPILKIKPKDIYDAFKARWDRKRKQVRRALVRIANVFDYAKVNRWYFGENPARWKGNLEHLFPPLPKTEREHFAAMPYEDMLEFMPALRQYQNNSVAATALEFLISPLPVPRKCGKCRGPRSGGKTNFGSYPRNA